MYKSRIWKWGLDKKLKSDEVLAILLLKQDRDALNKISVFTIRGQPVDMDQIHRYVKRNPPLVARLRAGQTPSVQTTLEVRCHTPSPSPPPAILPPTDSLRTEEILTHFHSYVTSCFDGGLWHSEYDNLCTSRVPEDRSEELFERVIASFALANRCMMRKDQVSISALLSPAFDSFKEIIATESPVFAVRIVCLLWYLDRHHKIDLLRLVMSYLTNLIPIVLGPNHIMVRVWQRLSDPNISDYSELSACLYSMLVPLLEKRIGPANHLTTILYGDHVDCLFHRDHPNQALALASRYRATADATGKQHPWMAELALSQTAVVCACKEADGQIEEAMECLEGLRDYPMSAEQQAGIKIQLGNYMYKLGDVYGAIRSYREATHLAVMIDGDERLFLTCLANLETALSKNGETNEAKRVLQYRLKRISDFAAGSADLTSSSLLPIPSAVVRSPEHSIGSSFQVPAIEFGEACEDAVPSWIWEVQDPVQAQFAAPILEIPTQWLDIPGSLEDMTKDWGGSSAVESCYGASRSQYPSLSPSVGTWDDDGLVGDMWEAQAFLEQEQGPTSAWDMLA